MDPFLGEIRIFGGTFAPVGWAACNGQLLAISEYDALYALLGTTYGGDGQTNFAVPNLSGRAAVGAGTGRGLSPYVAGQTGGQESVSLTTNQMPAHQHTGKATLSVTTVAADQASPAGNQWAKGAQSLYASGVGADSSGANAVQGATEVAGGSQPHENRQPSLAISYIIATSGIFPSPG